jgi:serine protease Do
MIGVLAQGAPEAGSSYAVPVNQFRNIILDVLRNGQIKRPWLGINYVDLTGISGWDESLTQKQTHGALVWQNPKANTPAAQAGLKANDIILSIDGQPVDKNSRLADLVQVYKAGDELELEILRQGKTIKVKVKLGILPVK